MAARDYWGDDEQGANPCACGRNCAERDYQGNPARGPRAFCETDRRYIGRIIRGLPETYTQVSFLLAKSGQQEEKVSGSREAPVPVSLDPESFMRHMMLVALSWEEQVRSVASLSNPDTCRACDGEGANADGRECGPCLGEGVIRTRPGAALQRASELLGGYDDDRTNYLDTLLSLEPELKRRPLPGAKKLADCEPGAMIFIDAAGDAWENAERGGIFAGLEFVKLNGRARSMLGLSRGRRRVLVPCDGCDSATLVQREAIGGGWEPVIRCTNCPETYIGAHFELLMGREYQAQKEARERDAVKRKAAARAS
jgi:hypothetical protein